jgi:ABC-type lipoprotein release transport system permease subunit
VGLELRLAWRNIWRNGRRTALTVAATVFAVFLVVMFVAMAAGVHEKMIEDSVRIHSGHLQLAGEGYLQDRTLEQYLELQPGLLEAIEQTPGVVGAAPRVVAFGLFSMGQATRGAILFGVDPEREASVSTLPERISQGAFLPTDVERPVVLGERLARRLGAEIGDPVLLYSVAYSLEMAYEIFTVAGLMRLPEPNLEGSLALIALADAQAFFVYGDRVSEVALLADDPDALGATAAALRGRVTAFSPRPVEVNTWNQVMPELEQFIFLDDAGMYIMLVILVVVVAFGILNTILMSVLERTRELGVLLALGLRPGAIFRMIYLESLMLAGIGLLLGLALAIPAVLWFQGHPVPLEGDMGQATELLGIEPIMTWKLKPLNPIGSSLTIFGVAALAALYPALKASRSRPVDALRSL